MELTAKPKPEPRPEPRPELEPELERGAIPVRELHPGSATGRLLVLQRPVSFWGGVDPLDGKLCDPRHPQFGQALAGRIVVMERTIGSSSSSAVMLELLRGGVAPAGIVIGKPDAILILGVLVAAELGHPTVPVAQIGKRALGELRNADGKQATLAEGALRLANGPDG